MGSALGTPSTKNVHGHIRNGNRISTNATVKCKRHRTNDVTHYNSSANGLLCLTCYQNMKRSKHCDMASVHAIDKYTGTIAFKQRTNKVHERARGMENRCEHILRHYEQTSDSFERRREGLINEVTSFITSLIELLKHLKEDLCREINELINKTLANTAEMSDSLTEMLKRLKMLRTDLGDGPMFPANTTVKLDNMAELESYVHEVNSKTKEYKEYVPKLKLNKTLSLGEILGNSLNGSRRIKLGKFNVDAKSLPAADGLVETLDDVSDESSVPNTPAHSIASLERNTINTPFENTPKNYEERVNEINNYRSNKTPPTRTSVSGEACGIGNGLQLDNNGYRSIVEERLQNVNNAGPSMQTGVQLDSRAGDGHISAPIRLDSRRVNFSRAQSSRHVLETPRASNQSVLSPGKIDTPSFISPIPEHGRVFNIETGRITLLKTIPLPKERNSHNITSTALLSDGHIVLCDQKNAKLSLFNGNFSRVDEIQLVSCPHNVTTIPDFGVASTFPDENSIKYIKIDGDSFRDCLENIKCKTSCRGVGFLDGNLIYTTGNDVAVLRKDDPKQRTWKFKYAFRKPMSLHVETKDSRMYVTCFGMKDSRGEVVKMNFHNQSIDFVSSVPEITRPVSTAVDQHGYMYVCDVQPPAIHQLSPDGVYVRKLLGENDGTFQHINFLPGTNTFIATENNKDSVKVYQIE